MLRVITTPYGQKYLTNGQKYSTSLDLKEFICQGIRGELMTMDLPEGCISQSLPEEQEIIFKAYMQLAKKAERAAITNITTDMFLAMAKKI